ncbi:Gramicidin S synthase 2 [compost metagenome]
MDVETGYLEVTEEEDLDHVTFSKERVFTNKEYIAPETETEIRLVNIIKEVLCLDEVGIKDNMFELGGDSLKAMVILNKIKSEFSLEYSLKNLMDATDLHQISQEIQTITDNKITLTF